MTISPEQLNQIPEGSKPQLLKQQEIHTLAARYLGIDSNHVKDIPEKDDLHEELIKQYENETGIALRKGKVTLEYLDWVIQELKLRLGE